jgi:hypothetical protein
MECMEAMMLACQELNIFVANPIFDYTVLFQLITVNYISH